MPDAEESLTCIRLFADGKRSAAEHMAVDEALLFNDLHPVLRFYSWARPTVSCGYFGVFAAIRRQYGEQPAYVRRWTGGGTVLHGEEDATYALTLPAGCPWGRMRARALYRRVHAALADALCACGVETAFFDHPASRSGRGGACFQHPVAADLLVGQRKIAGAAIRRCARGILLQGSIQGIAIPAELPREFARTLALRVDDWHPHHALDTRVAALVASRYGREEWMARR